MPKINPLIIALDTSSPLKALHLVSKLKVTGVAFKVGLELFLAGGPKIVGKIINHHVRVFLDLKFHDIPNTVIQAANAATRMGVWMFNVHAGGGLEMMKQAKEASVETAQANHIPPPLVLGVTVLTSLNNLQEINIPHPVEKQVQVLATLAKKAQLDGVVASGEEATLIRKTCGDDFCIVTPGIRLQEDNLNDQKRVMNPNDAIKAGSNYLVIGRPVTASLKPIKVVDRILSGL